MFDIAALLQQQINQMNPEYQQQLRIVDGVVADMAIARKGKAYSINDIIDDSDMRHLENCKVCKVTGWFDEDNCAGAKRRVAMGKELKF